MHTSRAADSPDRCRSTPDADRQGLEEVRDLATCEVGGTTANRAQVRLAVLGRMMRFASSATPKCPSFVLSRHCHGHAVSSDLKNTSGSSLRLGVFPSRGVTTTKGLSLHLWRAPT